MGKSKRSPCDSEVPEGEYVVEDVLGKKIKSGKTFYKIKWEGYPENQSTWEPSDHLGPSLVRKYEKCVSSGIKFSEYSDSDSSSESIRSPSNKKAKVQLNSMDGEEEDISGKMKSNVLATSSSSNRRTLTPKNETFKGEKMSSSKFDKQSGNSENRGISRLSNKSNNKRLSTPNNLHSSTKMISLSNKSEKSSVPRNSKSGNSSSYPSIVRKAGEGKYKVEVEEQELYIVEKIVGHRYVDGIKEYRIRWKGYPPEDDTWQTSETFSDPQYVALYEKVAATNSKASSEYCDGLLKQLLREVRKGKMYNANEIINILASLYDEKDTKYYLVLLMNKDFALLKPSHIPSRFRNECSFVDNRPIYL